MKTIKQLAEQYQMSKQAMRKHVSKLPPECQLVGTNHTIYVTTEGQILLEKSLSAPITNRQPVGTNQVPTSDNHEAHQNHISDAVFDALLMQLEAKDEQLKAKDEQIAELQKLIDQEQKLHMATKTQLLALEDRSARKWWQRKRE